MLPISLSYCVIPQNALLGCLEKHFLWLFFVATALMLNTMYSGGEFLFMSSWEIYRFRLVMESCRGEFYKEAIL